MRHSHSKNHTHNHTLLTLLVHKIKDIAIFTLNPEGIIISWNPGARHLLGYSSKDVIGKSISFLFPEVKNGNKLHKDIQRALDLGQYTHETKILTKKKAQLWVNCVVTALWDREKHLHGFSYLVEDITARKEKDTRREEFISLIGHELKNPLTSIKSYLQILQLKSQKEDTTKLLPFIDKALMQIGRLSSLMDDLLDVSKIDIGVLRYQDMDTIDLDAFLQEVVDLLQPTTPHHKIQIQGKVKKSLVMDRIRFEQVINNLLMNAIKYSLDDTDVIMHVSDTKKGILIGVQDFGIGISEKDKQRVFQRFQRLPEARELTTGLGLGLYLASQIVFHYGGRLWVESQKGKGSTFYFTLPSRLEKK